LQAGHCHVLKANSSSLPPACTCKQVQQLQRELQAAHQQLAAAGADHKALLEVQQQLAECDSLVQRQAQVIRQLEQQLLAVDGQGQGHAYASGAGLSWGTQPSGQQQQVQQLEAENASLLQALQQAQLQLMQAQAAGACSSNGSTQLPELHEKLARLQSALALKEEQHQRQLRALRQEHERLRVDQGIRWERAVAGTDFWQSGCALLGYALHRPQ